MASENICKLEGHNLSKIAYACTNQDCKIVKYGCFICMQTYHSSHINEIKEFSTIKSEMSQDSEQYSQLISKVENLDKLSQTILQQIKEQLLQQRNKKTFSPEQLSNTDLNSTITNFAGTSSLQKKNVFALLDDYLNELQEKLKAGINILNQPATQVELSWELKLQQQEKYEKINQLFAEEKFKEVMPVINEVLEIEPNNYEILHQKGKYVFQWKRMRFTIQINQKGLLKYMINCQPQILAIVLFKCIDVQHYLNVVRSYLKDGNYVKAQQTSEYLLSSEPYNEEYLNIQGMLISYEGKCLLQTKNYDKAYLVYLQLDEPGIDPEVKSILGGILLAQGEKQQAISYYEQAIDLGHSQTEQLKQKIQQLKYGY